MRLPATGLPCTDGTIVTPGLIRGRAVIYVYPYTGRPGVPDPPGWDAIFGAHGSTPQSLSYSRLYPEFRKHGVKLFGLSGQETDWQREFVARTGIVFPLLSDVSGTFADALSLQRFRAGDRTFLVRRTFLIEHGEVLFDRNNVNPPEDDAAVLLAEVRRRWP